MYADQALIETRTGFDFRAFDQSVTRKHHKKKASEEERITRARPGRSAQE
jgi:hypothetical protein